MKIELGAKNCLYPLPTVLVGALVNGKPNFTTIAHVGIMDLNSVSLGMNKIHFSNAGIKENKTFSINIPSAKLVKEVDYCGLVSGKTTDKAALFQTFYGKLKTAPMIAECSVNMECELLQTVDFPSHDIFIGKVADTFTDESVLTNGSVDLEKLQPILFTMSNQSYYGIGKKIGKAWNIGKNLKK
jgi:flavin reductase (DIM6/NTAB) family NADH-FMN oxidoreductase RutF